MISASEALNRLRDGNRRFVEAAAIGHQGHRASLAAGQEPFAIVLGCSDSRVPAELVFDRVRPSVESVMAVGGDLDSATLIREAVRANVRASANHLRHGSEILERLIRDGGFMVVGAEYSLETGTVDFFDGV